MTIIPSYTKQKWKQSQQMMITILPQWHGYFWTWKSSIHRVYNKWELITYRCQLWVDNVHVFLHQNTSTNSVSISSNGEFHQMIRLLFATQLASLVAQNQYRFWSETFFHEKGLYFLIELFLCRHFSPLWNGSICLFLDIMEFYRIV